MLTRVRRALRGAAPLVGLWIAVAAYYVFVVSACHFTPGTSGRRSTTGRRKASAPATSICPNRPRRRYGSEESVRPANMRFWRWDHSYYKGHFYLYWGLFPALLAAGIKACFGPSGVPDELLTFGFFIIRLVAGTLLMRASRQRSTPPPRWALGSRCGLRSCEPDALLAGPGRDLRGGHHGRRRLHDGRSLVRTGRGVPGAPVAATAWLAAASFSFGLAGGSRLSLIPTSSRWPRHRVLALATAARGQAGARRRLRLAPVSRRWRPRARW